MNYINQIDRLTKEIADLRKAEAQQTQKETDIQVKINRASQEASRANSISMSQNKLREVERARKDLATIQKKGAEIAGKIADKSKSLHSYQERQAREDERERKKISAEQKQLARENEKERRKAADEQKRLIREREAHERQVTSEIRRRATLSRIPPPVAHTQEVYDFFISHAKEDKDGFVRGLAEALQARGAKVWYDEFTLKIGDGLRRKIEQGLANSRFGVVVLSKHFFRKEWPQKELDGLWSLDAGGHTRILPIWHEISKDEVARQSPMLADRIALNTSLKSTEEIADELYNLIL